MTYPQPPWQQSASQQYPAIPAQPEYPRQEPVAAEQRAAAMREIKRGRGHRLAGRSFSRYMSSVWIYAAGSAFILLVFPVVAVSVAVGFHEGDRSEAWWILMLCAAAALQISAGVAASFARRNTVLYPALGAGVAGSALFLLLATSIMAVTRSGPSFESGSWSVMIMGGFFGFGLVGRIANPLLVPGYTTGWGSKDGRL